MSEERFDNQNLREEIIDYLYNNAVPTLYTIESMTDDIVKAKPLLTKTVLKDG